MPHIILSKQHADPDHPDYAALHAWLTANEIDPMWIKVPSQVTVTAGQITFTSYKSEGTTLVLVGGEGLNRYDPVIETKTIPAKQAELPDFQALAVVPTLKEQP